MTVLVCWRYYWIMVMFNDTRGYELRYIKVCVGLKIGQDFRPIIYRKKWSKGNFSPHEKVFLIYWIKVHVPGCHRDRCISPVIHWLPVALIKMGFLWHHNLVINWPYLTSSSSIFPSTLTNECLHRGFDNAFSTIHATGSLTLIHDSSMTSSLVKAPC